MAVAEICFPKEAASFIVTTGVSSLKMTRSQSLLSAREWGWIMILMQQTSMMIVALS
jgi:hypothetical protein